jgi:hypothetical protein
VRDQARPQVTKSQFLKETTGLGAIFEKNNQPPAFLPFYFFVPSFPLLPHQPSNRPDAQLVSSIDTRKINMKFTAVVVGTFAALAAAQGSIISSALSGASSGASSLVSSVTDRSSRSSSASAGSSVTSSGASSTSQSSSASSTGSSSGPATTNNSVYTSTIFYQYPNTFHKPVSPTLLGSKVITISGTETPTYSLPKDASTFAVTVSNVTTTYTSTNTFHGAVSKSWLVTASYEVRNFGLSQVWGLRCILDRAQSLLWSKSLESEKLCPEVALIWIRIKRIANLLCQSLCHMNQANHDSRPPWVSPVPPPPHLRALLASSVLVPSVLSLSVLLLSCKKVAQWQIDEVEVIDGR